MSRRATLSLMGLYEWDNTLFDLFQIPAALDKNTLVNNLMAETAELEILYSNPVVLKNLIGVWSSKQLDIWQRLYETTQYEYDPIENYNRYESGTNTGSRTGTRAGTDTETGTTTRSGTDRTTGSATNNHFVAGYDVGTGELLNNERDVGSSSGSITHGEQVSTSGNVGRNENTSESENSSHELHIHGNIGVTTSQQMIEAQRRVDLFNVYDIIIEDFKMRFCILIY